MEDITLQKFLNLVEEIIVVPNISQELLRAF